MEVDAQLHAVAGLSDQKQKLEQYKQLLHSILASSSVEACINFVDHSKLALVHVGYMSVRQQPASSCGVM